MDSRLMILVAFVIASAVPSIKADGTPTLLSYNLTRSDCEKTKLCMSNPIGCDPSNSSCYFASTQLNTTVLNLGFELSGSSISNTSSNTSGYIALAVGTSSNVAQASSIFFVCGINNGSFFFQTSQLSNGTMVATTSPNVTNIQYSTTQSGLIQCAFKIAIDFNNTNNLLALTTLGFNASTFNVSNIANASFKVFFDMFQGSVNGTSLGLPKSTLGSSVSANLANVTSATSTATTTAAPTTTKTTSGSTSIFSLINHVLLLAVVALRLL